MLIPLQTAFIVLGLAALAALLLWWLADHRRGTAWAGSVIRDRFPDVEQIAPAALRAWLGDGARPAPQVIDARSAEEYALSHLPGAVHVEVDASMDDALRRLDSGRPSVVYCSAGYRACQLARRLRLAGVPEVANMEGGIFAWGNTGGPLEGPEGAVAQVHPYRAVFARLLKPELRPPHV